MSRWQLHKYVLVYAVTYFRTTILLNWAQETRGRSVLACRPHHHGNSWWVVLFILLNFWVFREDTDNGENYSGAA